jgi:hypothetical protein
MTSTSRAFTRRVEYFRTNPTRVAEAALRAVFGDAVAVFGDARLRPRICDGGAIAEYGDAPSPSVTCSADLE